MEEKKYMTFKLKDKKYKDQTIPEVHKNFGVEELAILRAKLVHFIDNSKFAKFKRTNTETLSILDQYIQDNSIELPEIKPKETNKKTDSPPLKTNINIDNSSHTNTEPNTENKQNAEDVEVCSEKTKEKTVITSKQSFKDLLTIFEEKILEGYDEKFKKRKFIRKEYKDYLCLRYGNVTYTELLESQDVKLISLIIDNI